MVLSHSALYEYFAIIGYNPAFGLKQERISLFGDASVPMPKSPLEATYEAKVIAHYPAERIGRPFAPEIASLALPLGVQLFTEQNVPRDPSFHSFVLVREDGSRLHGCSLIFYEELQSAELKKQIFDAQLGYYRDFASAFPVSASTSSESSSPADWQQQQPHQQHARKFTTHSLPRKLSGNKRAGGAISLANASLNKEEETANHTFYYKSPNSPLYISKCMAVINAIPAIYSSENLLHFIWLLINDKYSSSVDGGPALDDVLCWVLNEIPLPPPGTSVHMTQSPHFQISIKNPAAGELPFFDYPIETLFSYVPVDKFLKLLTSFMLEKHILIFSKNARTLMLIAECISALIFPFTWQMTYCPILPHSQLGFLAAPWSWLMGICLEDDNISEHFSQSDICFLNVDANRLEIPEDLPSFPRAQQFSGQLNALLNEFKENVKPKGDSIHGFYLRGLQFNAAIRSLFLGHFASLFSSYSAYLLTTGGSENTLERRARNGRRRAPIVRESTANFDKISFLVDQPESVLPFLSAFLETQMFTSFIDSKILSTQNPLQAEAVHIFDQKIAILQPENLPLNFANSLDLNSDFLSKASPSPSKTALEFRISPPPSRKNCPLYHGILPLLDPKLFEFHQEQTHSNHGWAEKTTMIQNEQTDENAHSKRKLLIMSTEQNADENDGEGGGQLVKHKDGNDHRETTATNAPMNLASQNWKFVEQLLKETKAKTKRILVAKMGKEAIHLGHGQLHMGISGVEENTLVAAFCDLLERIWSHGLKKKQGKSALWAYIIAYHEWEKKNSRTTSRRSSSVSVVDSSSPESGLDNCDDDNGNNNSPKALVELISSIRRIAGTLEMSRSRDNSPPQQADSNSGGGSSSNLASNNWSQSLLRAANVICEKITANTATMNKEEPLEERPSSTKCQQFIGKNKHGLPPRPPLPQPNHQAERSQNQPQQRRLFTPQLRRRNVADVTTPRARASTPTKFAEEKVQHQQSDERREEATYRKFIYQGPLKAVNNQQQQQQKTTERRSREATVKKQPRSASSQPNGRDLASHLSEDSLSKMAISTVGGGGTPKRRTRDLSSGPAQCQYAAPPVVDRQQSRNRSLSRSNSPSRLYERFTRGIRAVGGQQELRTLSPLPNTMAYDLKNIIRMTEIKTDIGYARAFIRLALERKLLYQYLKKLLSNTQVLQKLYKRNAFLRGDDEREQFLFHMLSLNAVDFFCFTNSFLTIKMRYQVMFVGSLDRFPASMFYVVLTGSLGCTSHIYLPANSTQFSFDFKNLGILSTLRVAAKEQADQKVSKWYLDYVLVRNCVTAQIFYFRCGRWFGRGIDDGALERLLVAEAIVSRPSDEDSADSVNGSGTSTDFLLRRPESPLASAAAFLSPRKAKYAVPNSTASVVSSQEGAAGNGRRTRWRSPSTDRRKMSTDSMAQYSSGKSDVGIASTALDHLQALEHKVGVAVNALMKHFLITTERDHQNSSAKLSTLLCADEGLLPCIDEIFSHGLVQRIFQRIYPWDYVEKVFSLFSHYFRTGESKKFTPEQRSLIIYAYKVVDKISGHNVVGKDGKFHLFVLLCLRDHIFPGLLMLMTWTPATSQMYDQSAFLRQPAKLSYLAKLIGSLNEFQFDYDKSLMHGITF